MSDFNDPNTILTVSYLNQAVARILERTFPLVWITGEISNFTRASSGHWYFTLKDQHAQVRSVMFKQKAQATGFIPQAGDHVEVRALVSLYAPRGDYQLSVESMRRAGVGTLYEAFVRMKERLSKEGLFDTSLKRPIPRFTKRVGIVSSPQAAALKDVLTTLARRAPHVSIVLYPTPVQGANAAPQIASAIASAERRQECDVLLICRGGGSIEDLWCFNEEIVARAIAHCTIPIISGVGHETDLTIADLVADLRAPTPTAAAELACVPRMEWLDLLEQLCNTATGTMHRTLRSTRQALDWHTRQIASPAALLNSHKKELNHSMLSLQRHMDTRRQLSQHAVSMAVSRLQRCLPDLKGRQAQLISLQQRLQHLHVQRYAKTAHALQTLVAQLHLLDPQKTVARGYAILQDSRGRIIRSPNELVPHHSISVQLANGAAQLTLQSVQPLLQMESREADHRTADDD